MHLVTFRDFLYWSGPVSFMVIPVFLWTVGGKYVEKYDPLLRQWTNKGSIVLFCSGVFLLVVKLLKLQ